MKKPIINESTRKLLLKMEISGAVFVSVCAVALHFLYRLSGSAVWAAVFASVNESIWEHIKIFTLPYVLWVFVELCTVRVPFRRFLCSKVIGLYFLLLSIPLFYYAYTFLLGKNIAFLDISCGFVFTAVSFIVSYRLIVYAPYIQRYYTASVVLLVLYCLMTGYFTFLPPRLELFRDPITGAYGLPVKSAAHVFREPPCL